mmetsp:Transcript_44399/g.103751  ORF Transcript_44399/g.103751 Transcript_44399/m.103751 type:complete len:212 (+) Transcript_44399:547-1182(+)
MHQHVDVTTCLGCSSQDDHLEAIIARNRPGARFRIRLRFLDFLHKSTEELGGSSLEPHWAEAAEALRLCSLLAPSEVAGELEGKVSASIFQPLVDLGVVQNEHQVLVEVFFKSHLPHANVSLHLLQPESGRRCPSTVLTGKAVLEYQIASGTDNCLYIATAVLQNCKDGYLDSTRAVTGHFGGWVLLGSRGNELSKAAAVSHFGKIQDEVS